MRLARADASCRHHKTIKGARSPKEDAASVTRTDRLMGKDGGAERHWTSENSRWCCTHLRACAHDHDGGTARPCGSFYAVLSQQDDNMTTWRDIDAPLTRCRS